MKVLDWLLLQVTKLFLFALLIVGVFLSEVGQDTSARLSRAFQRNPKFDSQFQSFDSTAEQTYLKLSKEYTSIKRQSQSDSGMDSIVSRIMR